MLEFIVAPSSVVFWLKTIAAPVLVVNHRKVDQIYSVVLKIKVAAVSAKAFDDGLPP